MSNSLAVVVVTYRRDHLLRQALASVERAAKRAQITPSIYVWVNGQDAPAREILSRIAPQAYLNVDCHREERHSPAQARNLLLRQVQEDWVLFLDDDAFLPEDAFVQFLKKLNDWPNASVFGGPNLTPPCSSRFEKLVGIAMASRLATWFSADRYRKQGFDRFCGEESLMLCNLFVRRADLDVDPFPSDFVCAEENWLMQTLVKDGKTLVHAPELAVFHHRRSGLITLATQVFRYGIGRGQNIRLRPDTGRLGHFVPSICLLSVPLFVYSGEPLPFIVYGLLCLVCAIQSRSLLTMPIFALIHVFYGFGVLVGLSRTTKNFSYPKLGTASPIR
jgi:glycosyltransferase involved in cell wall biosynthesis